MARYIFIMGGVMSGIGKGVTTASIGKILKSKGFKVSIIKIDPYLNIDAGTMNPMEHGEVFVTKDGVECDQDMGNYERFCDQDLADHNYLTSGRVYQSVLNKERNLEYQGRCVEAVPDIPNEIIARIKKAGELDQADFVIVEIGGTVGEYQNLLFLEAGRMLHLKEPQNVIFILVSYLPIPNTIGEMKTKPTQTAVRLLNEAGIQPDIIIARSKTSLDEVRRRKLSIFCNVNPEDVISAPDIEIIYEVPLNFEKDKLGQKILKKFGMKAKKKDLQDWENLIKKIKNLKREVKIGIVGKYFETGEFILADSYISVIEAIKHASWYVGVLPKITWLTASNYQKNPSKVKELNQFDGIIVPGGFGTRDIEGKITAINWCRKKKIPYLGLCFGLQLAVIEFARNVCGLKEATSEEFDQKSPYRVVQALPEQKALLKEKKYGGTMRLGEYECEIIPKTKAYFAYCKFLKKTKPLIVLERHRHRYEINNDFLPLLEKRGFKVSGKNPDRDLVEIMELKNHPFFVGTQFHPEFKSRPLKPHPLFVEFINQSLKNKKSKKVVI